MQDIKVGKDIRNALEEIRTADGPIRVNVSQESGRHGVVSDLFAVSSVIKNCPHKVTVRAVGVASIIPFVNADYISLLDESMIRVGPVTVSGVGDLGLYKNIVLDLSKIISRSLERWPKVKAVFDSGEELYLTTDNIADYEMGGPLAERTTELIGGVPVELTLYEHDCTISIRGGFSIDRSVRERFLDDLQTLICRYMI